jgi:hypothetical protein
MRRGMKTFWTAVLASVAVIGLVGVGLGVSKLLGYDASNINLQRKVVIELDDFKDDVTFEFHDKDGEIEEVEFSDSLIYTNTLSNVELVIDLRGVTDAEHLTVITTKSNVTVTFLKNAATAFETTLGLLTDELVKNIVSDASVPGVSILNSYIIEPTTSYSSVVIDLNDDYIEYISLKNSIFSYGVTSFTGTLS